MKLENIFENQYRSL